MDFKSNQKISRGIRQIARKQVADICKLLKHQRISSKLKSVHEARKHIKKLRALLRLVREGLGRKAYHRQNAILRKMAQALSDVRDSTVQLKTLASLRRNHPGHIPKKEFTILQQALLQAQARRLQALKASKALNKEKLKRVKREVGHWKTKDIQIRELFLGIEKARTRFASAYHQAKLAPNDETIHEWRKRTKDLLYQSCFLENVNPDFFGRLISGLKKLGEHLGDAHDLAMLETEIAGMKPGVFAKLLKLSKTRRLQLQKSAFQLVAKKNLPARPIARTSRDLPEN